MTLTELMKVASKAYSEDLVMQCYNEKQQKAVDTKAGDTLALFIAREIVDTYEIYASDAVQALQASETLDYAAEQLTVVARALKEGSVCQNLELS